MDHNIETTQTNLGLKKCWHQHDNIEASSTACPLSILQQQQHLGSGRSMGWQSTGSQVRYSFASWLFPQYHIVRFVFPSLYLELGSSEWRHGTPAKCHSRAAYFWLSSFFLTSVLSLQRRILPPLPSPVASVGSHVNSLENELESGVHARRRVKLWFTSPLASLLLTSESKKLLADDEHAVLSGDLRW